MSRVFIQPARNDAAAAHIAITLDQTVGDEVLGQLEDPVRSRVRSALGETPFHLWAPSPSDRNRRIWEHMEPGDTVLVYAAGENAFRRHEIRGTLNCPELGRLVWKPTQKGVFRHLYSLGERLDCDLELPGLRAALGRRDGWRPMGFEKLDGEKANSVLATLGVAGVEEEQNSDPSRRRDSELEILTRAELLNGIQRFKNGENIGFHDLTKFDLLQEGERFPPKAICGLATIGVLDEPMGPKSFSGGLESKCFRILAKCGFEIVPKDGQYPPTEDESEFEASVDELLQVSNPGKPEGYEVPRRTETSGQSIARCPQVTAFVLKRAGGICACCLAPAPFSKPGGAPYLEVHHVHSLGEGGRDMIDNAVAICPNCHRECHHGESREALKTKLLAVLGR